MGVETRTYLDYEATVYGQYDRLEHYSGKAQVIVGDKQIRFKRSDHSTILGINREDLEEALRVHDGKAG